MLKPLIVEPTQTNRKFGHLGTNALVELASLTQHLAPVLGLSSGRVVTHGDFCPWNAAPSDDGELALWDWESTRLGLPLEDYFHWHIQLLLRMGIG